MNVWSARVALPAIAFMAMVAAVPLSSTSALTPTPSNTPESTITPLPEPPSTPIPGPYCPTSFKAEEGIDPSASASLSATWNEAERGVQLTWATSAGSRCALFQVAPSGNGYDGSEVGRVWPNFILAPGSGVRLFRIGGPGRTCYRLFAFSATGHSEPAEACVDVAVESIPTPPPPGNYPTPRTPWPPPTEVGWTGHFVLLDDNNFPLPFDQQTWFAGVSWRAIDDFEGWYEVQRAQVRTGEPLRWQTLTAGMIPASAVVDGHIRFEEQVSAGTVWCFRVRATEKLEFGEYSQEQCMPQPPSSGGASTVVPAPPDVGNTQSRSATPAWFGAMPAALALGVLFSGLLLLGAHRRSTPPR